MSHPSGSFVFVPSLKLRGFFITFSLLANMLELEVDRTHMIRTHVVLLIKSEWGPVRVCRYSRRSVMCSPKHVVLCESASFDDKSDKFFAIITSVMSSPYLRCRLSR